jgi:hypothetical protein
LKEEKAKLVEEDKRKRKLNPGQNSNINFDARDSDQGIVL